MKYYLGRTCNGWYIYSATAPYYYFWHDKTFHYGCAEATVNGWNNGGYWKSPMKLIKAFRKVMSLTNKHAILEVLDVDD